MDLKNSCDPVDSSLAVVGKFLSDLLGVFAEHRSAGTISPGSLVLSPRMPWIEKVASQLGMLNFNEVLTGDALGIVEQLLGIANRTAGDAATL